MSGADLQRLLDEARSACELARAAGADDAVATVRASSSTEYSQRDGKIEKVQESVGKALTVQLYVDGRYSSHGSNDLSPESLKRFLADAVTLTRALEPDPSRVIPDPALYEGRSEADLDLVDPAIESLGRDGCLARLAELDEACHADEALISATSTLQYARGGSARVSSNGFEGAEEGTAMAYVAEATVRDEGDRRPEDYAYAYARHLEDLPTPAEIGTLALQRALARRGSAKAASARTTMVVDREAAASLLGRALGALSAAAIQQKRSYLAGKLGERIAAETLTLTDEPLLVRGLGSCHYDGEGIAARPRVVVEEGVLRMYFVDTYYGRKLGWEPTTGSRSNTVVAPGTRTRDELLADVGSGIYVTDWAGGNADSTTGDFSFGIRGHEISGGVLTRPVGEMNVTGNYLDLLARLVAVGADPFPYSATRSPSLAFEDVEFSGV